MLKIICTSLLLAFSVLSLAQRHSIDSMRVTEVHNYYNTEGVIDNTYIEIQLESCSDNNYQNNHWSYYCEKDTTLVYRQTDFVSASLKEKLSFYWDSSDQHYQDAAFIYEKYNDDTKTYFFIEVYMEKSIHYAPPKSDTLLAQNIQSRHRSSYTPEPFYMYNTDTNTIKVSSYIFATNISGEQSLNKDYPESPEIEQYVLDSVIGKMDFEIADIRAFMDESIRKLESTSDVEVRTVKFDSVIFSQKFEPSYQLVRYNASDKRRPSYLTRKKNRYRRIEKQKNYEVWRSDQGNDCDMTTYEIYSNSGRKNKRK